MGEAPPPAPQPPREYALPQQRVLPPVVIPKIPPPEIPPIADHFLEQIVSLNELDFAIKHKDLEEAALVSAKLRSQIKGLQQYTMAKMKMDDVIRQFLPPTVDSSTGSGSNVSSSSASANPQ